MLHLYNADSLRICNSSDQTITDNRTTTGFRGVSYWVVVSHDELSSCAAIPTLEQKIHIEYRSWQRTRRIKTLTRFVEKALDVSYCWTRFHLNGTENAAYNLDLAKRQWIECSWFKDVNDDIQPRMLHPDVLICMFLVTKCGGIVTCWIVLIRKLIVL